MKHLIKHCLVLFSIILSFSLFALPDDFQQKLEIEADRVYLNKKVGNAIYEGNVIVKQGSILIEAERLTMMSSKNAQQYDLIYAKGSEIKDAKFSQQIDEQGNMVSGQGMQIFYNTTSGTLEVRSGLIKRANDEITADFIKYMMKENVFEAKQENGGRVSMTLQPQSDPE